MSINENPPVFDEKDVAKSHHDQLKEQMRKEKESQMSEQEKRLRELQDEVENLREYQRENEVKLRKPKELDYENIEENKENERAKEYYKNKSVEIEQLLSALGVSDQSDKMPVVKESSQVEALLRFMIKEVITKDILKG